MNTTIFYLLLVGFASIFSMEQPHSFSMEQPQALSPITKEELISLIKKKKPHGVQFALQHREAKKVIDSEVLEVARKNHTEKSVLSRSGSIVSMIEKQAPIIMTDESALKKFHKSGHRHPFRKDQELKPKDRLLSLIKHQKLAELEKEMSTSSVHFVDQEIRSAAELECQSLAIKLARAKAIVNLFAKYPSLSKSEKRRSCIVKFSHETKGATNE